MIIAISAAPPLDTNPIAKKLATEHKLEVYQDPLPEICRRYGFQTLYDMPTALQLEIREKVVIEHVAQIRDLDKALLNYSVCGFLADWMRWAWAFTSTEKWEEIRSISSEIVSHYDAVYHLEHGPVREYDGYVWFDRRNADQINGLLKYVYSDLNISEKVRSLSNEGYS
jgi:hypothetical protein